ncbi:MAG: hypothetical protein JWO13_1910 [Acidobacteriales bacterium]|nr:hypothetical protein [Terriglobales bacterium]
MLTFFLAAALLFGGVSTLSGKADSTAYRFGTVHRSCAPWDGTALAFDLRRNAKAEDNSPRISISIYKDIPHGQVAAPLTFPIDIHENMGNAATRCAKPGGCWPASKGTVTLSNFEEGKGASGSYELYFQDGTVERGKFNVRWQEFREMCG